MNALSKITLALATAVIASQAAAEVTFYEHNNFGGRSFNTEQQIENLRSIGFNNRASSVVVDRDWWQVCEDPQFGGRCVVLRPGRYASLGDMGLNDRISSIRLMSDTRHDNRRGNANPYLPSPDGQYRHAGDHANDYSSYGYPYRSRPVAPYDYHRRYNERTYEANVTSVRAVVGPPEQRCWVEREQVIQERQSNAPGAIVGALIGGILGHQIGAGSGKDLATAGGVVAGAVVGANISREQNERQLVSQDVQHCANTHRYAKPEYWDVTYTFRGVEHRIQTTGHPGASVTVNERGEPRL